jgi:hypothetical protein
MPLTIEGRSRSIQKAGNDERIGHNLLWSPSTDSKLLRLRSDGLLTSVCCRLPRELKAAKPSRWV